MSKTLGFLCLMDGGWGEVTLGIRLAHQLHALGHRCVFMGPSSLAPLFQGGPFPLTFSDGRIAGVPRFIHQWLQKEKADALVLSDLGVNSMAFQLLDPELSTIESSPVPVVAMDIWRTSEGRDAADLFGVHTQTYGPLSTRALPRLELVPFLPFQNSPNACNVLPQSTLVSAERRREAREKLGIPQDARLVFFVSASWQWPDRVGIPGKKVARLVPLMLAHHVDRTTENTHLLHVGPRPYALNEILGRRYHWVPQLPPSEFVPCLAASDVLVTLNISATTIAAALMHRIPVMVLRNSHDVVDLEGVPYPLSERMTEITGATLPLYPFHLWPLGYHRFLQPILKGNPYRDALMTREILDEDGVQNGLRELTEKSATRDALLESGDGYLGDVRSLPLASELLLKQMER